MEPTDLIIRRLKIHHGVARKRQFIKNEVDYHALRTLVAENRVNKFGYGCYGLPGTPHALIAARCTSGLLTCSSALRALGVRTLNPSRDVHISLPKNRGILRKHHPDLSLRIHREPLPEHPLARPPHTLNLPVMPTPSILVRSALCLPEHDFIVALDACLEKELVTKAEVLMQLSHPVHRHVRKLVREGSETSQSVTESLARLELQRAGYDPKPQAWIDGVGFVDLLIADAIVVELDGFAYHRDREQFRNDRRRDRELNQRLYRVLRYAFEDIVADPSIVVRDVDRLFTGEVPARAS